MAQMSSEEALNGIFNILDTMVNQHEEKKKETLYLQLHQLFYQYDIIY